MKRKNEYSMALSDGQYVDAPKAVLAALAMSLAVRIGGMTEPGQPAPEDEFAEAATLLAVEWRALHEAGIVPQPLPSSWRGLLGAQA